MYRFHATWILSLSRVVRKLCETPPSFKRQRRFRHLECRRRIALAERESRVSRATFPLGSFAPVLSYAHSVAYIMQMHRAQGRNTDLLCSVIRTYVRTSVVVIQMQIGTGDIDRVKSDYVKWKDVNLLKEKKITAIFKENRLDKLQIITIFYTQFFLLYHRRGQKLRGQNNHPAFNFGV